MPEKGKDDRDANRPGLSRFVRALIERDEGALERYALDVRRLGGGDRLSRLVKFGVRRDKATGELKVVPGDWLVVERIFDEFARASAEGTQPSLRLLAAVLQETTGRKLDAVTIHRILRDPFYVTGESTVAVDGTSHLVEVSLLSPISQSLFDDVNRQLDAHARERKQKKVPIQSESRDS